MNLEILGKVAEITNIKEETVKVVMQLIEEGATIPFIARYRKEKTNNLNEEQLREITLNYEYQDKLLTRKNEVINNIKEKGKLTPELESAILKAETLNVVEELYLPYKEKRKTRATIAIAKGLEPLADYLMKFLVEDYREEAKKYITEEVKTVEEALQGASDIIAERISDDHVYRDILRTFLYKEGFITTSLKKDAKDEKKVYENYYNYREPLKYIANHRVLAINRGEDSEILKVKIEAEHDNIVNYLINRIVRNWMSPVKVIMKEIVKDAYERLLFPSIEREIRNDLTEKAQDDSIKLFSENLAQLLLTPPFKNKTLLGVDPAFRTGCKVAVVNGNGDFVYNDVIYPHEKYIGEHVHDNRIAASKKKVIDIIKKYNVELIAIGNGTASRETEEFIASLIKENNLDTKYIIVSEAGASVYSASPLAKEEFPSLQVEERSAISIARRVLDPLAELIKIEPRSIGVGQYQHDVNQSKLSESLDFTVLKVVNSVGVNLNSASSQLLSYVSGLNKKNAQQIIEYRKENGKIKSRAELKKVKGIGPKTYEQAIGFLKILDSANPLDKTFIHPDDYDKVKELLSKLDLTLEDIGSDRLIDKFASTDVLKLAKEVGIGEFSAKDIIEELQRPLRDIRDEYPTPTLKSDILHIEDLRVGMKVQGTVRSIVDFGVFVDIGLKNDGMIHKSKLSKSRVRHPLDVVSIGDIVDVYIIDVNLEKGRVALSMFNDDASTVIAFNN
jgi:uncharacterized protein